MAVLATALVCLTAPFGCASSAGTPAGSHFAVSYVRSGGLAGMPRALRVKPGRRATVQGRRSPAREDRLLTVRFRIGIAQVKRLRRALARAHFGAIETPAPESPSCADCFSYTIRYRGHRVTLPQMQVPKRLWPVINRIEAMIDAHLPFH